MNARSLIDILRSRSWISFARAHGYPSLALMDILRSRSCDRPARLRLPVHLEAEVRAHLGAELAPGAAIEQQGIAVALAVHRLRHHEHARRADRNAEQAPLAELLVDGDGGVHLTPLRRAAPSGRAPPRARAAPRWRRPSACDARAAPRAWRRRRPRAERAPCARRTRRA